jgi:hypothetical protein
MTVWSFVTLVVAALALGAPLAHVREMRSGARTSRRCTSR